MKIKLKDSAAVKEIKALLPYYTGGIILLTVISTVLMLTGVGDYTLLTGAFAGTLVSFVSFAVMAFTAERSVHMSEKNAKLILNGGYAARYIAAFIILGALMYFKLINPVTALLPLFIPKIGYTVQAFREKSGF